jgi:uncharacterized repeat protein (TIGR01451 family)
MTKQNIFLSLVTVALSLSTFARPAYADMCTTQYGGSQECKPSDLTINKQVRYPIERTSDQFVENLISADPTYAWGSEVTFRLIIKNTSGETFDPVNVKDKIPDYLTFIAGSGSSPVTFDFDKNTNDLNFKLEKMIAGETRSFDLRFKVTDTHNGFVCEHNVAEVRALNRFDSDTAQVCFGDKSTLGVTTLPVAGFNDLAILLPFAGVALGGFALLRKQK